ncbi:MAG: type II secretion system protein [Clostridia bacterium]
MKIVLKERLKTHKGITLIALVITIIVLLILAGVAIATLTGDNGIIAKAQQAKMQNDKAAAKEKVDLAIAASFDETGKIDLGQLKNNLNNIDGINPKVGDLTDESFPLEVTVDEIKVIIKKDGNGNYSTSFGNDENLAQAPTSWVKTTKTDSNWYSYNGDTVNAPKLVGKMTPIKYNLELPSGANTTNKWANAITADGSMWVWIPRYAYKITYYTDSNYTTTSTTKTQYGKIDVAFVKYENGQNTFLNSTDSGIITTDPTAQGAGTTNWLVHPAFVNNVNNGGWDSELSGIWVGKFETTGAKTTDSEGNVTNVTISVLPGKSALTQMKIKDEYKYAKLATFGENISAQTLGSHMAKNSEWGVIVYLAYSKYGTNGKDVKNNGFDSTGGTTTQKSIYHSQYEQSTTNNPYGVYDLRGCSSEDVASYVNYEKSHSDLSDNGGTELGDLYESGEERATSTKYKTVYTASGTSESDSYNLALSKKGDAIFETSTTTSAFTSWNNGTGNIVPSYFPYDYNIFFIRGGDSTDSYSGMFYFSGSNGGNYSAKTSFRMVLCP